MMTCFCSASSHIIPIQHYVDSVNIFDINSILINFLTIDNVLQISKIICDLIDRRGRLNEKSSIGETQSRLTICREGF